MRVILILLLHTLLSATLIIDNSTQKYEHFDMFYFYDENDTISAQNIAEHNFSEVIESQFTLGYKTGTSWFKIEVQNHSKSQEFFLYFTESIWQELNLFCCDTNASMATQLNGNHITLKERVVPDVNPTFKVFVESNSTKTFYIQGKSVSGHIGEFQLFTSEAYYNPRRISITNFYIFYSAVLLFVMITTMLLYATIKDNLYLYYMAYVVAFLIWVSVLGGYYLYFGIPAWNDALHATGALVVATFILFSAEILSLKEVARSYYYSFRFFAVLILFFSLLITLKVTVVNQIFNIASSLFFIYLLYVVIKLRHVEHIKSLVYYQMALGVYMPTMALMTLNFNGFIANVDVTRYAFILGSFLEIILFSFILFRKFVDIKAEKIILQERLLVEQANHKRDLEDKIEERTHDLHMKNEVLKQQKIELEAIKEKLLFESTTDTLSGLYNRRYFSEVAERFFETSKRSKSFLGVLMLDLDKFKVVNDTYGHSVGDEVIVCCAKLFKDIARKSDIVTRYGGEEFIILLPDTNMHNAMNLAQRINEEVANNSVVSKEYFTLKVTVSIGVAEIEHNTDNSIDDIIRRADEALYMAKENGRNRVERIV